jgi:hypothetical protein
LNPQVRDFILFCIERRGREWPAIYDEMTSVAGQRLFNNLDYSELKQLGLSLKLNDIDKTIQQIEQVMSQNNQT